MNGFIIKLNEFNPILCEFRAFEFDIYYSQKLSGLHSPS
jgi:hypothetical protein